MCIYKSTCSCEAGYVDYKKREFAKRTTENYHARLSKGEYKSVKYSILKHLRNSGHIAFSDKSFKIIYIVKRLGWKGVQMNNLFTGDPFFQT